MRETLLNYLVCPACMGSLSLVSEEIIGEEILEGHLTCQSCHKRYHISKGIPIFMEMEKASTDERDTVEGFSYEWHKWAEAYHFNKEQFLEWVHPVEKDFFKGKIILDAGCGMGRWSMVVQELGAKDIVAVDMGNSIRVAYRNFHGRENIHAIQASIFNLPLRDDFDFVFSLGVIHHTPDPKLAFQKLVEKVKPGCSLFVWIYGYENNEFIVKYINPIRRNITSKIPKVWLNALSHIITIPLHLLVKLVYKPLCQASSLNGLDHLLPYREYMLWLSNYSFKHNCAVVFDQLVPSIAFYIKREAIEAWFTDNKLTNVKITPRNNNSWRGWGFKPKHNIS